MQNLNKKFILYSFVHQVIGVIILVWFVGMITLIYLGPALGLAVAALMLALSYGWSVLVYKNYKYTLEPVEFKKELGVINKKYVSIPYSRIQNVDINRGLLERMFGLSTLKIQTAGASAQTSFSLGGRGAEGVLPGLSHEVAEQLRAELVVRSQGGGQQVPAQVIPGTEGSVPKPMQGSTQQDSQPL